MPARVNNAKRPQSRSRQLLTPDKLRTLYATMLQCRMVKERARSLFQQGRLQENVSSRPGREASEVGALVNLEPGDYIAPRRRDVITGLGLGCGITTAGQLKDAFSRMLHRSNHTRSKKRNEERLPQILASESS